MCNMSTLNLVLWTYLLMCIFYILIYEVTTSVFIKASFVRVIRCIKIVNEMFICYELGHYLLILTKTFISSKWNCYFNMCLHLDRTEYTKHLEIVWMNFHVLSALFLESHFTCWISSTYSHNYYTLKNCFI